MTEEQKRKFQEKYDDWYPTEEQFQNAVNEYKKYGYNVGIQAAREECYKKLEYHLHNPCNQVIWESTIIPLLENLLKTIRQG